MNRRRIRRYRNSRRNSGMKFLGFIGIMIAAVICGYLTARFIIAPLLGYDTEVLKLDFPSKLTSLLDKDDEGEADGAAAEDAEEPSSQDDDAQTKSGGTEEDGAAEKTAKKEDDGGGYALQFGLFSDRARAEKLLSQLEADGIDAQIRETDGQYKVISPVVETKDEAVKKLKETETDAVSDVFITVM